MKDKILADAGFRSSRRWAAAMAAVSLSAGGVLAETYTWSAATSGAAQDGAGTWDTAGANWVGAGDAHAAWNSAIGDTAAFGSGGTAGTVTVHSAGITVGGLVFNSGVTGTYALLGGPLTLTGSPVFAANAGATIGAFVTGDAGFTKTGAGTLAFSCPSNTVTGDIGITAGAVACNAMNQAGTNSALGRVDVARTIAVGSGATLLFNASDAFGNDSKRPAVTVAVRNGGTVRNNGTFTTFGPLNLEGGTLTSQGGAATAYQAYQLKGTVTSGGDSAINTTGGNYNGVHVYDNTFAVTGGTLAVSAPLINRPSGTATGFTKTGGGKLVLAADNAFSGVVSVSNGMLQVGSGGAAGTLGTGGGAVNLVSADASLVFNRSAGAIAVSGAISGAGSLVQTGYGLLTLSGANTYAGGTAVSNGVLAVTRTNALPGYGTAGKVTLAPGAGLSVGVGSWPDVDITALISTGVYRSDTYFGFDTTAGNYSYSNQFAIPAVAGLLKTGPNALTVVGSTGCAGGVAVMGGILQADFGAGIPATTNVTLVSASLSSALGSLTNALGAGAGQINLTAGTACGFSAVNVPLTVNLGGAGGALSWGNAVFNPSALVLNDLGANTNLTFINGLALNGATRTINVNAAGPGAAVTLGGVVADGSGAAGLVKGGTGTLVLTGANTFTGGTTVNAGTLALAGGNDRLSTAGSITINAATLDLGGGVQSMSAGSFAMNNNAVVQNGAVNFYNASWSPGSYAAVTFGAGGGMRCLNRLLLMGGQTLTLASGAGSVCFGGNTGGSANYIGVDNNTTNAIIVNGGSLDLTNSAAGAGYLRIGANGNATTRPFGSLTVNGGAVNVGHSMSLGARWDNGSAGCFGNAALTLNGGEVNVGTGTSSSSSGGNRGWLYLGNSAADTVSRSAIALNGGALSLVQLEVGAYGTNTLAINGGTLRARADNAAFINGTNLAVSIGASGAAVDTAGYKVGVAANLLGCGMTGGLVKRGAGTLVLGGSNTYCGVTSVTEGTLSLPAPCALPTGGTTQLAESPLSHLRLRLDASDVSTLCTNASGSGAVTAPGQKVGYWGDLSGNATPATQATPACRPVYVTGEAAFNGLPVLQFDGVDDDITSSLDINATNLANMTLVMVYRQVSKVANGGLWGHDDGGWDRAQLLKFANGTAWSYSTEYPVATSSTCVPVKGMDTDAALVYTASLKNGVANGSYIYVNGLSDATNGLPGFTSTEVSGRASLTLANISGGNGYHGNIQIGEVLVFDAALSDADRRNVENYLRDKWVALPGRVEVAAGAVLDFGGTTQTLSEVRGSGTVSNGTLTVLNPLSPAGAGIGTVLAANIALNGTLRADVGAGGTCDQLVGSGNLSLSGLFLQIADTGLLNRAERYTVVTCSGTLTGTFAGTNLPDNWHVAYDRASGSVAFYYSPPGTLVTVR